MTPYYRSDDVTLYHGDCRALLAALPERSVQCVLTSPPYWGLRDYGIAPVDWSNGETSVWGLEKTLESYIEHTLEVMDSVRRVLRDDGCVWLNLGDSYGGDSKWGGRTGGKHVKQLHDQPIGRGKRTTAVAPGSKLLIPHRVAIALQDDGWCVRQDVQFLKKSPMPESVSGWHWHQCRVKVKPARHATTGYRPELSGHDDPRKAQGPSGIADTTNNAKWADCLGCPKCIPNGGYLLRRGNWRHTTAHEAVFMLTKGLGYFCDGEVAKEETTGNAHGRGGGVNPKCDTTRDNGIKQNDSFSGAVNEIVGQRNPRSFAFSEELDLIRRAAAGENIQADAAALWESYSFLHLANEPFKGPHFAAFPTKLVIPLLQASTSLAGCCPQCGQCWAPVVEKERKATRPGADSKVGKRDQAIECGSYPNRPSNPNIVGDRDPQRHVNVSSVSEYRQTCECEPADPVPCTVMDVCSGSGTTGQVARHLGLRYIGIDCNAEYLDMSIERINTPLVKPERKRIESSPGQMELFGDL